MKTNSLHYRMPFIVKPGAFRHFRHLVLLLTTTLLSFCAVAQNFTVSGTVKDAGNGEDLIGALIGIAEMPGKGTASNSYGFYSITLPAGNYTLVFQSLGYQSRTERINLTSNLSLNIELSGCFGASVPTARATEAPTPGFAFGFGFAILGGGPVYMLLSSCKNSHFFPALHIPWA
jgi:hypothetical protein